jgi:hypothetical protein
MIMGVLIIFLIFFIIVLLILRKKSIIIAINIFFLILLIFFSSVISYLYITPISVDPQNLNENVSINNPENFTIAIKNTNPYFPLVSGSVILKYKINGLNVAWLKSNNSSLLESQTTSIKRGKTEFVQVTIDVQEDTIPGKYNGEILILDNNSQSDDQPYKIIQTSLIINKPASNIAVIYY